LSKRPAAHPDIIATSSEKGDGIADMRAVIASLVDLEELGYKGA
jgi:GTP-binding protein